MSNATQHLGIPMPDPDGQLEDDVLRLRSAFQLIDSQIWTLREVLSADDANLDTIQEIITVLKAAQGEIGSLTDILATKADKAEVTALAEGLIRDELTAANSTWSSSKIGQALEALSENLHTVATQIASSKLDKSGGVMTGPITFARHDNGLSTPTTVIDWRKGQHQRLTLNGNVKLEFVPPDGNVVFIGSLKLINNAAATYAVTWPAALRLGGVAPQVPDAKVGASARYSVMWDGEWEISGGRFS